MTIRFIRSRCLSCQDSNSRSRYTSSALFNTPPLLRIVACNRRSHRDSRGLPRLTCYSPLYALCVRVRVRARVCVCTQVIFVDEKSRSFVKENDNCDFYISGDENSSGILENPKHSLPPNTTCRYHFQGKLNEIVWLSFVKYYAASVEAAANIDTAADCNAKLLIWDGDITLDKLSRKVRMPNRITRKFYYPRGRNTNKLPPTHPPPRAAQFASIN